MKTQVNVNYNFENRLKEELECLIEIDDYNHWLSYIFQPVGIDFWVYKYNYVLTIRSFYHIKHVFENYKQDILIYNPITLSSKELYVFTIIKFYCKIAKLYNLTIFPQGNH